MRPKIWRGARGMMLLVCWAMSFAAVAIEIDSDEKLLKLLQNEDFRDDFLRLAWKNSHGVIYVAADETSIAIGSRGLLAATTPAIPQWLHTEAKAMCQLERRNRGVQSECKLLVERDRFVPAGISLVPSNLASLLRDPDFQIDESAGPWSEEAPLIPSRAGDTSAPVKLIFCDDETSNESDAKCLTRIKVDPQLARLEAIKPVTQLSTRQVQDLRLLERKPRFKEYLRKYEQAPDGKALALAIDGERVATGLYIGRRTNRDRLTSMVLDLCRKDRIRKKIESGCFLYLFNDHNYHPAAGSS